MAIKILIIIGGNKIAKMSFTPIPPLFDSEIRPLFDDEIHQMDFPCDDELICKDSDTSTVILPIVRCRNPMVRNLSEDIEEEEQCDVNIFMTRKRGRTTTIEFIPCVTTSKCSRCNNCDKYVTPDLCPHQLQELLIANTCELTNFNFSSEGSQFGACRPLFSPAKRESGISMLDLSLNEEFSKLLHFDDT